MKKSSLCLEIVTILLSLVISITGVKAATNTVQGRLDVYTLPSQPAGQSPKGKGQDRQSLGYIMEPGSTLTITNDSDVAFTVQLLNNNSAAQVSQKVNAHSTVSITAPNPPKPAINGSGKKVSEAAADVDLVPFISTPRTAHTNKKVTCNFSISGPTNKLPIFSYDNNDQSKFMDQWKQSGSYALISGKDFQILLPVDAQLYVENMGKAPMGMGKNGNPKPVPEGNAYICHNLNDVLHFYDDILFPTYHQIAGLSADAKDPYNVLVPGKYFYTADIKGAGGANYSPARTEISGPNDTDWLQPSWVLFHETGHGYQTRELGSVAQHVGEVSNNALGNYMYYHVIYKDNPELADKYSWNYNGNKEKMENDVHKILMDNDWSWDQILPNNGGRGKHVGLILLQNMIEKMSYDGWTEVYKLDRQQIYNAMQNKEKDLDSKLMNIWDLITKAASDHGYDYTAVMTQIGKKPQLPLSQEARDKQNKVVNFLWNLMPNSSYDEVFNVVQQLEKADPNLVFDSNFTLVTPDQMKSLNLNGKLNLTIYDLPSSWSGKTINIMNGDEVYGTLTIGPDGKCSLDNVPLGTYTLAGLPNDYHKLTNYYVTVTNDPTYMNSTDVIGNSSSSEATSSSKASSSKKSSAVASSSKKSSSSVKSSLVENSVIDGSSSKESSVIVPSKPDTSLKESSVIVPSKPSTTSSTNGNGATVPSKPSTTPSSNGNDENVPSKPSTTPSSNGNDETVPSKPSTTSSTNGNGATVPSKPSTTPSSNGNDENVPSKPSTTSSTNGNGATVSSKPSTTPSSNGNDENVPSKPSTTPSSNGNDENVPSNLSTTPSSNGNEEIVSSKSSATLSSNTKYMNDATNNLKVKNGKDLPQTGETVASSVVSLGILLLVVSGFIFIKEKK